MIKYFIRHYWRYLAMALAFATISFLINSCEVRALERIQSIPLGYTATLPVGSNDSAVIYNSNSGNYANWGRGYLSFSLAEYWTSTGTSTNMTTIREINVTSSGNIYVCNFGSVAMDYDYEENVKVVSYSVVCDVTMGANGLQQIKINHSNGLSNSVVVKTSDYMTFTDNLDIDISTAISTVTSTMQTYLQTIINQQTNYTQSINTTITNVVNSNFATLSSILNNGIDAINGRLDQILTQNQVCNYYDKNNIEIDGKAMFGDGTLHEISYFGVSNYIKITNQSKITLFYSNNTELGVGLCFYNTNKNLINCILENTISNGATVTIPNNASYIRFTINKRTEQPQLQLCDTAQNITNSQNEQIIQQQNETNDTLKDSSVDDPDSDLEDMQENEISNSVISDLLLLPINMFENIIDAIGGTCSSFPLGELFGTSLVLPCINIPSLIGNNLWNVIDILFCGIFVLSIRKKFVDIFENITSLKDRGNELE